MNRINLRNPESNKKEAKVWKDFLSGQNVSECKHVEEHRRFDYFGLRQELENGNLDQGLAFEGSEY